MQHFVSFSIYKWEGPYLIMVTGPGRSTEGQQPLYHVWIAAGHIKHKVNSKSQQIRRTQLHVCFVCFVSTTACTRLCSNALTFKAPVMFKAPACESFDTHTFTLNSARLWYKWVRTMYVCCQVQSVYTL